MQSKHPDAVSRNLRVATENRHSKPDTRRFAGIFPLEVPEAVSIGSDDTTCEERNSDCDDPSRWEFVSALDGNISITQNASVENVDESSTLSTAQEIIAWYHAVHGSDHAPKSATTEIMEKGLPQDDQRSMYTLATSADAQSTMDMMWRPKPKVHMRHTDQRALIQALQQNQAFAMMHGAGLKPTNKIQCRRRGCADILPGVEALKYHIHIHNIADTAARHNDASPSAVHNPSLVECSTSSSKTSKRSHSRSKSSIGTQQSYLTTYSPPRKLSAGGLLPSLFSPRESTPEFQLVPNLTTVAKALTSDTSQNMSTVPLPVRKSKTPSTHTSTSSRGRRMRKESKAISVGAGCNPSIATLLSPPTSPVMQGRHVLTLHTNSPMSIAVNSAMNGENEVDVSAPDENAHPVPEMLTRSRSPMRALSPTRAMSPIRNGIDGIRRVLSLGYSVDFTDE